MTAKLVFFTLVLALQGWIFYEFCIDYSKYQLENEMNEKWSVIAIKSIVAFFQLMSVICMLRIFLGNPGFVSDYFTSVPI